jgi:hypothetical protein
MSRIRKNDKQTTILVVASGGGHWVQLLRLRPAFEGTRTVYVSVQQDQAADVAPHRFYQVPDANRSTKLKLAWQLVRILYILLRGWALAPSSSIPSPTPNSSRCPAIWQARMPT